MAVAIVFTVFIPFGSITDRQEVDVEVVLQLLGGLIRVTSFFHVESRRKKSKDIINFRHEGTEMKKGGTNRKMQSITVS